MTLTEQQSHDLSKEHRVAFWKTAFPFANITDKHFILHIEDQSLKGNKQQFKIPMPEKKKKCTQRDNSSGAYCLLFIEKRMHTIENI